jgi:hypothetical protein
MDCVWSSQKDSPSHDVDHLIPKTKKRALFHASVSTFCNPSSSRDSVSSVTQVASAISMAKDVLSCNRASAMPVKRVVKRIKNYHLRGTMGLQFPECQEPDHQRGRDRKSLPTGSIIPQSGTLHVLMREAVSGFDLPWHNSLDEACTLQGVCKGHPLYRRCGNAAVSGEKCANFLSSP